MEFFIPVLFIAFLLLFVRKIYSDVLISKREKLIDSYVFPAEINKKIINKYPHLTEPDTTKIIKGLREYFHLCNIAGKKMVSMPSQAVDVAWHEFILYTKKYEDFCMKSFGRFLHHTPAEAMTSPTVAQEGIKTAWKISCHREKIEPQSATRLPTLFAMDADLNIEDGFKYALNCMGKGSDNYCASHIGCGSGCGSSCGSGCGGD